MTPHDLVLTPRGLRFLGRRIPCILGHGGARSDKREGDGATPKGCHRVVGMLYRADRMKRPGRWAVPIGPFDLWSDDPRDAAYNSPVHAPYAASHERLARPDPLYDLVLVTDWNMKPALPGHGSAIFIHRWRRPGYPTAGCVAMAPESLLWVATRLWPGARLIVR